MSLSTDPVQPAEPAASPPAPRRPAVLLGLRQQVLAALAVVLAGAVLGLVAAVVWHALADRVKIVITSAGPDLNSYATNEFFAGDGMFAVIGLVVGLALGVGAWTWRRQRGAVMLVGSALGALAAALICWQVGRRIGLSDYRAMLRSTQVGLRFLAPVRLRSTVALVVWPLAATLGYVVPALLSAGPDLHLREDLPAEPAPDPDRP